VYLYDATFRDASPSVSSLLFGNGVGHFVVDLVGFVSLGLVCLYSPWVVSLDRIGVSCGLIWRDDRLVVDAVHFDVPAMY
jgi:hypothetical protein